MKSNKPLISVIVPVYNGEKYIGECIESILNQDYKNFELIIVNDGSKDNSLKIIKEYGERDKRIVIIDKENGGVSSARNSALKILKGEYICFVDQDDCICEDYISYFYDLITKNDADIALTPTANRFSGTINKKSEIDYKDEVQVWTGVQTAINMLYYKLIISPWNKMISAKLVSSNDLEFDLRFFSGEGFLFSIECFQRASKVAVGKKKVYLYRVDNPNSGMTKFSMHVINSSIDAQKVIHSNLLNPTKELEMACKYSNWHTHCDCLNTLIGCKVLNRYKDLYKKIKKVCKKDALVGLKAPISKKEKLKCILYFINPYIAARIINHFRVRKFTIES